MKTAAKNIVFITFLMINLSVLHAQVNLSQGRFMRGAGYPEFTLNTTEADFYVSPDGNDSWSGTLAAPNSDHSDGPFATIERAKAAVRELKGKVYKPKKVMDDPRYKGSPHKYGSGKDIVVLLREGTYNLDRTLEFTPADGGDRVETDLPTGAFEYHKLKDHYVTYAAYPGDKVVISGGKRVTGWNRKHRVWETKTGKEIVREVFVNGRRMTLARTPNRGWFSTDGQPTAPEWFRYRKGDIKSGDKLKGASVYMKVRWTKVRSVIDRVDRKKRTVYLAKPEKDMLFVPPKYLIENAEALLDTAGEWYFDADRRVLKVISGEEIKDLNSAEVLIPEISQLISVKGTPDKPVRNLRFYGLEFGITAPGGGPAINMEYVVNCEFIRNKVYNVSQTAISLGKGCCNNLISYNDITDVKNGSGIYNSGTPRPQSFAGINSDNKITFNTVDGTWSTGISTRNAQRTEVLHNYVVNTGSYGITVGSWPNVEENIEACNIVEFNHVSFTNQRRDDEGGIAVYGLTHRSVVKNNLIHDVTPAETNENVGLFFQNMSKGWTVTDNIYFNLKQGELKYCAAYPVDNVYRDNFVIEKPAEAPEKIITGKPEFRFSDLKINAENGFETGKVITISAKVENIGSTGIGEVRLYVDCKVAEIKKFPVVKGNSRTITFKYKFTGPGGHSVAVESIKPEKIEITGKALYALYSRLKLSNSELPVGDTIFVSSLVENVRNEDRTEKVILYVDGKEYASKDILLKKGGTKLVEFPVSLKKGVYKISIGDQPPESIKFYDFREVYITDDELLEYCSGTAKPCSFTLQNGKYEIEACGTDFLHAEDSYGAIYLNRVIKGDFVATVKVTGFSEGVSEWIRAGIFVRNDISKSNESEKGSKGAFLAFTTTKRAGAQWDEFGDGSMHNTKSYNYNREDPFPVWLKVVREKNVFTAYYSFDGKNWVLIRRSTPLPGLSESMDIGIASGTNDQKSSKAFFEDFRIVVEK